MDILMVNRIIKKNKEEDNPKEECNRIKITPFINNKIHSFNSNKWVFYPKVRGQMIINRRAIISIINLNSSNSNHKEKQAKRKKEVFWKIYKNMVDKIKSTNRDNNKNCK